MMPMMPVGDPPPPQQQQQQQQPGAAYGQMGGGPSMHGDADKSQLSLGGGYRPPPAYANAKSETHEFRAPESLAPATARDIKYEIATPAYTTEYFSPPPRLKIPDYRPKNEVYKAREHEAEVQQGIPYSEKKQYDVQLVDYKHYFPMYTTTTTTTTTYTTTTTTTNTNHNNTHDYNTNHNNTN